MYDRDALGGRIREYRLKAGMTQDNLAEKIGMSTVHISHVENGYTSVSMDCFLDVCNALEVTPNDLLLGQFVQHGVGDIEGLSEENAILLYNIAQTMRDTEKNRRKIPKASPKLRG